MSKKVAYPRGWFVQVNYLPENLASYFSLIVEAHRVSAAPFQWILEPRL